jgi:hypothetical protein
VWCGDLRCWARRLMVGGRVAPAPAPAPATRATGTTPTPAPAPAPAVAAAVTAAVTAAATAAAVALDIASAHGGGAPSPALLELHSVLRVRVAPMGDSCRGGVTPPCKIRHASPMYIQSAIHEGDPLCALIHFVWETTVDCLVDITECLPVQSRREGCLQTL